MDIAQENVLAHGCLAANQSEHYFFSSCTGICFIYLAQVSNLILVGPVWSQAIEWQAFCACVVYAGTQSLSLKCRRILTFGILVFFPSPSSLFLKTTDGQGSVSAPSHAVRAQICSQWKITRNQINSYGMVCFVLVNLKARCSVISVVGHDSVMADQRTTIIRFFLSTWNRSFARDVIVAILVDLSEELLPILKYPLGTGHEFSFHADISFCFVQTLTTCHVSANHL